RVSEVARRFTRLERVNPLDDPLHVESNEGEPSAREAESRSAEIRGALLRGGARASIVGRDDSPLAPEFLGDAHAVASASAGAFTPDLIVYCRTLPLHLEATAPARAAEAVHAWRERHGLDPRIVIAPGRGVFHAAPDLAQLRVVAETWRIAMAVALR